MDTSSGIAYLSESVSKYSFSRPDKIREQMISSKVSGDNRAFSFNQASEMNIDFYENIVKPGNISPRGFISPVSASAMLYYNFRLDGTYLENDIWINRIEVTPKRKADPVFSGYIYIQDGSWRIHSTDLLLTKDAQIQFVDSLRISQVYIPAGKNKKVWMPGDRKSTRLNSSHT